MAYIGKEPVYGSLIKQSLTPDGSTTAFTLSYYVSTAASVLVSVGGVIQSPETAYSITNGGIEITFTEAPAADVDVFLIYLGVQNIVNTVADGVITSAKLAENLAVTGNVTVAKNLTVSGTFTANVKPNPTFALVFGI